MLEPNEAATVTDSAPVDQVAQESAVDTQEVATPEGNEQVTPEQSGQQTVKSEDVDEFGIPWKERAREYQRKLAETTERLPKIVEETLAKQQAPQVKQYSIQELEQIALQNPELRPQVEEEKEKIRQNQFLRVIEERDQRAVETQKAERVRYESEQAVINDPTFKDCFTQNALGQKQWNQSHPLTRMIGEILLDPRIQQTPDGIKIAADIAYGRYARELATKATTQAKVLQANLKKEQKKTMVEGGNTVSRGSVDEFSKAKEELSKTGSVKAAQSAVAAYLKKTGRLR